MRRTGRGCGAPVSFVVSASNVSPRLPPSQGKRPAQPTALSVAGSKTWLAAR